MVFIDKLSPKPVYEQLVDGIEKNILLGVYPEASPLPSVRELSQLLGINPNTVQKSFSELASRGLVVSSPGNGCYVSENALAILKQRAKNRLPAFEATVRDLLLAGIGEEELEELLKKTAKKHSEQSKGGPQ